MVLDQAAKEPFEFAAPYLPDLQRPEFFYRTDNRRLVDFDPRGLLAPAGKGVGGKGFLGGKFQYPRSITGQHEPAADHVTQLPVGLPPIPGLTDQLR